MTQAALVAPPDRRLSLDGAVNCRDLGGYQTSDGRYVRWRRVFRSDQLAQLTDSDAVALGAVGIRTICDLRADSERQQQPNRTVRGATVHEIGFMPHDGDALLSKARAGTLSMDETEQRVRNIYRHIATDHAQVFAYLFRLLEAESLPLLFHCTHGRDRTGFAAAIILAALSVPRATIVEDYVMSNRYRRDPGFHMGDRLNAPVLNALTQAHPDYLSQAFAAIDERWGSIDSYLHDALGLTSSRRERLCDVLLVTKRDSENTYP